MDRTGEVSSDVRKPSYDLLPAALLHLSYPLLVRHAWHAFVHEALPWSINVPSFSLSLPFPYQDLLSYRPD